MLEEDGDSGHGGNQHAWKGADAPPPKTKRSVAENPVQCWKRENGLKFYFNCHSSPDFSPIENCWQGPKARVKNLGHFDSETTRKLARGGWESISQEGINKNVLSMPWRFKDRI